MLEAEDARIQRDRLIWKKVRKVKRLRNGLNAFVRLVFKNFPRRYELISFLQRVNKLELDHRGRNIEMSFNLIDFLIFFIKGLQKRYLLQFLFNRLKLGAVKLYFFIKRELKFIPDLWGKFGLFAHVTPDTNWGQKQWISLFIDLGLLFVRWRRSHRFGRWSFNIFHFFKARLHFLQLNQHYLIPYWLKRFHKYFLLDLNVNFPEPAGHLLRVTAKQNQTIFLIFWHPHQIVLQVQNKTLLATDSQLTLLTVQFKFHLCPVR